jgi:stage III sporulation protein AF
LSYLIAWVTNIILFILLATVIDMLLPNSSMQKYSKMVIGLLLIAIILTPIFKLISKDFDTKFASIPSLNLPDEKNMKNSIELKKKEIQASDHAYILEQMAVQLKKGVSEELMEKYSLEISHIEVLTKDNSNQSFPQNLEKVSVQLTKRDKSVETVAVIKHIEINTNKPLTADKKTKNTALEVSKYLSKKWNVDEKAVEVSIEGGNNQSNG